MSLSDDIGQRRTVAIISHPDAGKTTVTEKLLLLGNAIQLAGTVKAKKSGRQTKSDWMELERERGISVTTSVMQFNYNDCVVNLLDTPGHEDFSEDTYRTLTAVDSAIMVIDAARGVEPRTRKLLEICRMRDTPIVTFINKLDREAMDPLDMLEHIEDELQIECAPVLWPIGSGRSFRGCYRLDKDELVVFERGHAAKVHEYETIASLDSDRARRWLDTDYDEYHDTLELVREASNEFSFDDYRTGMQTPVFFGSALQNFGIDYLLNEFIRIAPPPGPRLTESVTVDPETEKFTGFVFKIQANMNPKHRDRIAFLRVCSGRYTKGMRVRHVRMKRTQKLSDAVTFMAGDRIQVADAVAGDIIGLHNHGTIQIGDTFTEGEPLQFRGIPNFAPELFRRVRVKNPLHAKRLATGVRQLAEEGATQVFNPLTNRDVILGAVGVLQFDVVAYRLREEYGADCEYEPCPVHTVRWVSSDDEERIDEFRSRVQSQLALDAGGHLALLATSRPNLQLMEERWPELSFSSTREHAESAVA